MAALVSMYANWQLLPDIEIIIVAVYHVNTEAL